MSAVIRHGPRGAFWVFSGERERDHGVHGRAMAGNSGGPQAAFEVDVDRYGGERSGPN